MTTKGEVVGVEEAVVAGTRVMESIQNEADITDVAGGKFICTFAFLAFYLVLKCL